MPNLHKVVFAEYLEVSDNVANFLQEYCPKHGQLGEAGAYYINEDTHNELKDALAHDLNYARHTGEIMAALKEIKAIVDKEGLYEFYLEN